MRRQRPSRPPQRPIGRLRRGLVALLFVAWALALCAVASWQAVRPIGATLSLAWQSRDWPAVQAEVLEQGQPADEDGPPEARALYRYSVDGRTIVASRIGVAPTGGDGFGDWQRHWAARLADAQQTGRTVTAWVDPAAPHVAVLDRSLRWAPLLWRLTAGLVLLGMVVQVGHAAVAAWQGQPGAHILAFWLFALVWSGASAPVAFYPFWQEPGLATALFAAMFWGGGLLMLWAGRHGAVHG